MTTIAVDFNAVERGYVVASTRRLTEAVWTGQYVIAEARADEMAHAARIAEIRGRTIFLEILDWATNRFTPQVRLTSSPQIRSSYSMPITNGSGSKPGGTPAHSTAPSRRSNSSLPVVC